MIDMLLPVSHKKMEILKYVYENPPAYLRKIATELSIHPYIVKRYIDALTSKKIFDQQRAGKTILLTINPLLDSIGQLLYIIECYKQKTEDKTLKMIIKTLQQQFGKNNRIISCIIFGSYARGAATKESDADVLFIIESKDIGLVIMKKMSQLGALMNLKFSPIIMTVSEFKTTIETKEPATVTLLKPSQRIIVFGIEYFVRTTMAGE